VQFKHAEEFKGLDSSNQHAKEFKNVEKFKLNDSCSSNLLKKFKQEIHAI
jgi:hypothetical protein